MKRCEFIAGISAVAWPLASRAQQPTTRLIGYLSSRSRHDDTPLRANFLRGLSEHGYIDGVTSPRFEERRLSNSRLEWRSKTVTDHLISNVTQKWRSIAAAISSIAAVGTLAVLAYAFIQERQSSLAELKKTAVSVPYDDLIEKPEDHIGQIVRFHGKVSQVVRREHTDKDVILIIWVGNGLASINDVAYVDYQLGEHQPRILRNQVVEFWGKFMGMKAPEPNQGSSEVPHVVAYEVEHIE